MDPDFEDALARASACSPFLKLQLEARPDVTELLRAGTIEGALEKARLSGDDAPDIGASLRRERSATALAVWCVDRNLKGFAQYFYKQSGVERNNGIY